MAPQVPEKSANFYDKANFEGASHNYALSSVTHLYPKKIADVYHSVNVGLGAKVNCWHHLDYDGRHGVLEGEAATLVSIGDLTCFSVDKDDTHIIQFRFVDKTGGQPKDYSLTLNLAGIGKKILLSDDGPDFKLAGKINASEGIVTTAIYLRNEKTGVYLATGSIYFKWNSEKNEVDIDSEKFWPKQLTHERQGQAKFLVTLVSNKPSEE
ncbi:membrane binding-domain-containing protein [Xylaria arbuscula]|nr:membrane binding-domain-containing protein [Xylaria arbuscula]